jgi:hypothetical protein
MWLASILDVAGPATLKSLQTHTERWLERWLQYSHTVVGVLAPGGLATMFNAPLNGPRPVASDLFGANVAPTRVLKYCRQIKYPGGPTMFK